MSNNKSKWIIMFKFENASDRNEVLAGLSKHTSLTWNNDSMESEMSVDEKKFTVNVKKGKLNPPKPFRL